MEMLTILGLIGPIDWAALGLLLVAFLGIALWTGFDAMMNSATERTRTQVEQIGG